MAQINWWHPDHLSTKKVNLRQRADLIRKVRNYFDGLDYLEVETPILQNAPVMEVHIKAFETDIQCFGELL